MTFVLTIIMVLGGKDFEENLAMSSLAQCWTLAHSRVEVLMKEHPDASKIGAGCTVDVGRPL